MTSLTWARTRRCGTTPRRIGPCWRRPGFLGLRRRNERAGRVRVRPAGAGAFIAGKGLSCCRPYELSEIHRQPLGCGCLNLRSMLDAPVGPMLAQTLEPPAADHVGRSLTALRKQGFLTEPRGDAKAAAYYDWEDTNGDPAAARRAAEALEGLLTPQGRFVALIGVDLRLGRVIAVGNALGCGPVAAAAAAVLSLPRSPLRIANPVSTSRSGRIQRSSEGWLTRKATLHAGSYSEPLALARLDAAYASSLDRSSFRAHCLAHGRAKQCAQACYHLRERGRGSCSAATPRPVTVQELHDPLQAHALRCVLVWTMKEQLVKNKAVRAPNAPQQNKKRPVKKVEAEQPGARGTRWRRCRL